MNRSKYQKQKDLFGKKLLDNLSELGTESYSPATIKAFINYISAFLFYLRERYLSETRVKRTDMYDYINRCKTAGDSSKLINRKVAAVTSTMVNAFTCTAGKRCLRPEIRSRKYWNGKSGCSPPTM